MQNNAANDQIPILRFLSKHKWRIILPLLFATFYWALPRYQAVPIAVQQNLFIKSASLSQGELKQAVLDVRENVLSDEFLGQMISNHNLVKTVESEHSVETLRRGIQLEVEDTRYHDGVAVRSWVGFRNKDASEVADISNELNKPFNTIANARIERYVSLPYLTTLTPTGITFSLEHSSRVS